MSTMQDLCPPGKYKQQFNTGVTTPKIQEENSQSINRLRRSSVIPPIEGPLIVNKTMKLHKHLHIELKNKLKENHENTPGHQQSIIVEME